MQAPTRNPSWEDRIGRIDRRLVYCGLFLFTLIPLLLGVQLPLYVTRPTIMLWETIEALPQDRLVLISSNWDAGTQAETGPQLVAIARHLIRRNLRFAIFSIGYPTSPQLAQTAVEQAILLEGARDTWVYGEDWINMGYKQPELPWLRAFAADIRSGYTTDWKGVPLDSFALMQGVRRFGPRGQISALVEVTGSETVDRWYEFLSPTGVKLVLGCTAVMAPEQYPYLDSGQLNGLLTGMKGAAEYEQLIGAPGTGLVLMTGQSFAHLYIVLLIALGNAALIAGRLERRRRAP
ncbi:MAG: hypothetical protein ACK47B_09835 [Armatimonadota bacterium]